MGQHEAGKHSKAGKKRAAAQPRQAKSNLTDPKRGQTSGGLYQSKQGKGLIRRILGF
jgi:hypothetical protein